MAVHSNKIQRAKQKIKIFQEILEQISTLSTSSRLKVACILLKKDFTKIASFGYNGNYFNAPINSMTGTEEESLEPKKCEICCITYKKFGKSAFRCYLCSS